MAIRKVKFVEGEYYHIYNRGVDKRKIFSNKADLQRFFQGMEEFNVKEPIGSLYLNTFNKEKLRGPASQLVSFIAFCLNLNHYHFLLTPLVESKNGAVIRKHMGRNYIQKKEARGINKFLGDYMDDYLNFHRPCGFSTDYIDQKGKIKKKYETYLTPYEKLISLPDFEQYLKPEISPASLEEISRLQSDNESAQKMQNYKQKLFKNFTL